ncbi:hypothetical protein [Chthoniobacter flavus]|uniref:hypothetical protein n=1 Tax=Chthoniobacter flavus TaxID=191863 RepID=UPI00104CA353|nr:hypothetical protein [Chthoniobacter flavus]
MNGRTIATLQDLEKAVWFSYVGVKDTTAAIVVSSWPDAISYCSSVEWGDLCVEASNQFRERLLERSKERFEKWNEITLELKKATVPFVQRKIEAVVREHNLPKIFEDMVQWDILGVCMEAEYADVYPPGFYASHAYWYVKGHFPCGWQGGPFPNGTLAIY